MSRRLTQEEAIEKFIAVHGTDCDYSEVVYKDSHTKVKIICRKHGAFWITPNSFISGHGCRYCAIEANAERLRKSREQFIEEAEKVHGVGTYDYSRVDYFNTDTDVEIGCRKHGYFKQRPDHHLNGHGCRECANETLSENLRKTTEQFITEAREIHGDKYDYSQVEYEDGEKPVKIGCPTHGYFWQKPVYHLDGCGCKQCNESNLERQTRILLERRELVHERWKGFEWLGRQNLDFYLPSLHIAIECQGGQHFFPVEHFGGDEGFAKTVERDQRKARLCEEHGLPLYYIRYDDNVEEILTRILEDAKKNASCS